MSGSAPLLPNRGVGGIPFKRFVVIWQGKVWESQPGSWVGKSRQQELVPEIICQSLFK